MTCHSCAWALLRSASPDRNWNFECCELGIIPMATEIKLQATNCPCYKQGETRPAQGISLIMGPDIEL